MSKVKSKYAKNFQVWHQIKSNIEASNTKIFFKETEIWWCAIGMNIGHEEDSKNNYFERPVLIFRKFSKYLFWGLPLTSKPKIGHFFHNLDFKDQTSTVILSQLRILSSKRLIRRMGKITKLEFDRVETRIIEIIKETGSLRSPQVPKGNL